MNLRRFSAVVLIGAGLCLPAAGGPAAARCLSPGEIQNIVRTGAILRLGVIARAVGGEVFNAQLCEERGLLVYKLAIRGPDGRMENVVVDATSGQRLR